MTTPIDSWLANVTGVDAWRDDNTPGLPVTPLRTDAAWLLDDTCTIKRATGSPRAMTTVAAAAVCHIEADTKTSSNVLTELNTGITSYILTVLSTQSLLVEDQVIHNGNTYEVDDLMDDNSPNVVKQARMARVSVA